MPSILCLVLRAKLMSRVFGMIARCGIKATVGSDALTKHRMSIRRRSTPTIPRSKWQFFYLEMCLEGECRYIIDLISFSLDAALAFRCTTLSLR